jgi:futalosine hydrolase
VEILPQLSLPAEFYDIPYIDGITVNKAHGSEDSIKKIKNEYGLGLLESMEGAAFFYVANKLRIPCIQVRTISNLVERRNTENWNIPLALKEINTWLQSFVTVLQSS